jgi:hypothetical protein
MSLVLRYRSAENALSFCEATGGINFILDGQTPPGEAGRGFG